jgi:hypothetical protein
MAAPTGPGGATPATLRAQDTTTLTLMDVAQQLVQEAGGGDPHQHYLQLQQLLLQ